MDERAETSLTPRAMREVAETDWTDMGSGGSVSRTEAHAKRLFVLFVAPLRASRDPDAENRAREWTVGALVGAFPRAKREDVRPKVRALVERVTNQADADAVAQARIAKSVERQANKSAKKGRA